MLFSFVYKKVFFYSCISKNDYINLKIIYANLLDNREFCHLLKSHKRAFLQ